MQRPDGSRFAWDPLRTLSTGLVLATRLLRDFGIRLSVLCENWPWQVATGGLRGVGPRGEEVGLMALWAYGLASGGTAASLPGLVVDSAPAGEVRESMVQTFVTAAEHPAGS